MIRFHHIQLKDIPTCVEIIAAHPVLGPRYGSAIDHLESVWHRLLGGDAFFGLVCEETDPGISETIGSYVACFITDEVATEIATPPLRWVGPELVKRVLNGPSPVLTDAEVRHANSTHGLNIVVWPTCPRTEYENFSELRRESQALFFDAYRGFYIKRLQAQAIHPLELQIAVNSGGWYLRGADPKHSRAFHEPVELVALQPHIMEATRAMASQEPGTWINQFFAYRKPEIGFPRSEQRLLSAALHGGTDEELAEVLGISLSAVKKMWASVYLRIYSHKPSDLKVDHDESADGDRGREKKQKLLVYLRGHPEELHPYSMKLLEQSMKILRKS